MCCHVDKQQSQSLAVKETTEISLSETVLPIGMEEKCSDQYEFQHEKVCVCIKLLGQKCFFLCLFFTARRATPMIAFTVESM